MEIYNKGKRDIIIKRGDFLSDNVKEAEDPIGKKYAHIEPEMICRIADEVGERLLKAYPGEIVKWGRQKKTR